MDSNFIFSIIILIMSVVVHEVSHGFMAYYFGDPTAKMAGRLTLNPLKHLDLTGSVIVPTFAFLTTGFIFGWAKPVPYNPYNLRNAKIGEPMVALAGPLSNFSVALIFGLLIRFGLIPLNLIEPASLIVLINIVLGSFNLVPIPPLDGSKILFGLLPYNLMYIREFLEKNWFWFVFIFIFFVWRLFLPVIYFLFSLLTGLGL
ncbi:site-2 protease family protein [Patescibacteria group bacterium]|nr:site-2 protease family protein [Patescibacteria group bacterium]MCG2694798.1 site-2 protease family protein [Candidatus Parcubacteria bacterium]